MHKILEQFEDILVRILLLSAILSFLLTFFSGNPNSSTSYIEPIVILLILVLNAVIGVLQDLKAEKALDCLIDMQSLNAKVIRDGNTTVVDSSEIVIGDIILLDEGDKVPADIRII